MHLKPYQLFALAVFLGPSVATSQSCTRPTQPEIAGETFRALQKRAAYAAFLADECGFENEVQKRYNALVRSSLVDSPEAQKKWLDEFRARKSAFASDASYIAVKKRCILDTGKTKALVNDAADDVSAFGDSQGLARKRYTEKMDEWNACLARQKIDRYGFGRS